MLCTRAGSSGPKVFLWGDSFAAHYVPGFMALGKISPSSSFNIPSLVARLSWITSR